jgi:hypothetical protein
MLFVSLLLLTLWLGALVLDVTMGGLIHLLAGSALGIVLARRTPRIRHA